MKKKALSRQTRITISFFMFIMPALLGYVIFTAYPMLRSLYLSFTNMSLLAPDEVEWVGFKNYRNLFNELDPFFKLTLKNTFKYAIINILGTTAIALLSAMLLTIEVKFKSFFKTVFYLPSLLPTVAIGLMFRWVFDPANGIVNSILRFIGVSKPPIWLESAETALTTVILISLYGFGGKMLIFLSGLNGISKSYYEAAELDGAGYWRRFFNITVPLLSPIIFYNVIIGTIGALQVFETSFVSTGAGPGNSTLFYVLRMYNLAYNSPFKLGQASAMAWVLFGIIGIVTGVYFLVSKKFIYYENDQK